MRSDEIKRGVFRAPHRALLKAMGLTDDEIKQPFIGIANSANEIIPGHIHLNNIVDAVKTGIRMADGTPMEFSTIGICDGLAMDHNGMNFSLPSRELIADSIELVANATPFDGIVFVSNCDKITPGMLMAMGRLNIPSVLISGGPMLAGSYACKPVDLVSVFEGVGKYKKGEISKEELEEIENCACPGVGSCSGLFTANSMNALAEGLGVSLKGNGTIPAVFADRVRLAKETGKAVMELVKNNVKPRDIVTKESFENAVMLDLALGGSSNTVLHLKAIAESFNVEFDIDIFDKLSRKIPHICNLSPIGNHHIEDLHRAGGVFAVMNRLFQYNLLNNVKTISFETVGEIAKKSKVLDNNIIRPFSNPYHKEGGLAVLYGNLAFNGAVAKIAGVPEKLKYMKGKAVVFDNGESAAKSILNGNVKQGDIVVIRYEGPKGGPGMREMLAPTSAIVGIGLVDKVALITDGRFSGGSTGAVIGHISPEAAEGGLLAVVKDGDLIEIDFDNRRLSLLVDNVEIERRLAKFNFKGKKDIPSVLKRYSDSVMSASKGAVFKN